MGASRPKCSKNLGTLGPRPVNMGHTAYLIEKRAPPTCYPCRIWSL